MPSYSGRSLEKIIAEEINQSGPMTLERFMTLAMTHPEFGYYTKKDPLGACGDFVTAPEISQIFGELIAVWLIDCWQKICPGQSFTLLECGPGHGTLMADILRVLSGQKTIMNFIHVNFLEINSALKIKQEEKIAPYIEPQWVANIESVSQDRPIFTIANEFLDALPMRQFVHDGECWKEQCIGFKNGKFEFTLKNLDRNLDRNSEVIPFPKENKAGLIWEYAPQREAFFSKALERVAKQKGASLWIDYGSVDQVFENTFQAVQRHQKTNVLENIGESDLTSHVDFSRLRALAESNGISSNGPVTQAHFLKNLGFDLRLEILKKSCKSEVQRHMLMTGAERLVSEKQMGHLFKVLGCSSHNMDMAGF